jgi:hypothetical protein
MVYLRDETIDGGLEIDHDRKTPRFSRRLASLAKEPLDGVEPRTGGRREESWSRKSAQDGKWNFCLTAGTLCEVGPVQFFRVE